MKKERGESFRVSEYVLFLIVALAVFILCVGAGSVSIPLKETVTVFWRHLCGMGQNNTLAKSVILSVRLPRVICVALSGAALAISGAAMQGLLKNPLADGSTLGVSSGAALGAVFAIAFGITFPGLPFAGTVVMAVIGAFFSLLLILALAYRLDYSLDTNHYPPRHHLFHVCIEHYECDHHVRVRTRKAYYFLDDGQFAGHKLRECGDVSCHTVAFWKRNRHTCSRTQRLCRRRGQCTLYRRKCAENTIDRADQRFLLDRRVRSCWRHDCVRRPRHAAHRAYDRRSESSTTLTRIRFRRLRLFDVVRSGGANTAQSSGIADRCCDESFGRRGVRSDLFPDAKGGLR